MEVLKGEPWHPACVGERRYLRPGTDDTEVHNSKDLMDLVSYSIYKVGLLISTPFYRVGINC